MFWKKTKLSSPSVVPTTKNESSWWSGKKETRKISTDTYPSESDVGLLYQEAYSQVRSIVPKGSVFEGSLSYQVPVRIEGILNGDLVSSSDVILAPGSQVHGRVECQGFYNFGEAQGVVQAVKTIIYPHGKICAEVNCNDLCFANGAIFEGRCRMNRE